MTNKNYRKGYEFERQLVNLARGKGLIAFRSAGSHSPIDVVIIDKINKQINLVQCKNTKMKQTKLKAAFEEWSDNWKVVFQVSEKRKK